MDRHTHWADVGRLRSAGRPRSDLPSAHTPGSTQAEADRDLRFSSPLRSAIVARRHRRPPPRRAQAGCGRARRKGAAGSAQQPKAASTARCGATPEQAAVNRQVPGSSPGAGARPSAFFVRDSGMAALCPLEAISKLDRRSQFVPFVGGGWAPHPSHPNHQNPRIVQLTRDTRIRAAPLADQIVLGILPLARRLLAVPP
jgi:hypothetical protein